MKLLFVLLICFTVTVCKSQTSETYIGKTLTESAKLNQVILNLIPEYKIDIVDSSRLPNEMSYYMRHKMDSSSLVIHFVGNSATSMVKEIYLRAKREHALFIYKKIFKPTIDESMVVKNGADWTVVNNSKIVFSKSVSSKGTPTGEIFIEKN